MRFLLKKTSLFLVLLLLASVIFFLPVNVRAEGNVSGTNEEGTLLLGFESERELISPIMYVGINKVERSEEHVTQGNYSLHICPVLAPIADDAAYGDSHIAIYSGNPYFSKTKFLDCEYLSVDIYNPSETDYILTWTVDGDFDKTYTVKPGPNTLFKYISRQTLSVTANGNIGRMSFIFDGRKGSEGPLDLYFDNLRCYTTEIEYVRYEAKDNMLEKGFTFKDEADLRYFGYQGRLLSENSKPLYEINTDYRYCKSTNRSMRVTFRTDKNGMLDTTYFRTIDNVLGDLTKFVGPDNYYISTAMYNAYDYPISCGIIIFSNYHSETYGRTVEIPANSWANEVDTRIYMNDLDAQFTGDGLDIMTLCYYFERITTPGCIYIDSIDIRK